MKPYIQKQKHAIDNGKATRCNVFHIEINFQIYRCKPTTAINILNECICPVFITFTINVTLHNLLFNGLPTIWRNLNTRIITQPRSYILACVRIQINGGQIDT